jgi:hypothetical protein
MLPPLDWQTFGIAGAFIGYLIYDRQILIKTLTDAVEANTDATNNLAAVVQFMRKG